MSDWQPIETAPKDGTVMLFSEALGVVSGMWWGKFDGEGPWGDSDGRFSLRPDEQPTHWMPLPSPPTKDE